MATAAAAAAEANAASAERTAARAAKKLARQQEKSKAAAKSRPATKNPVRDAARQRRATAGHQTMVTTFEVLLRLLLMAAGGSVAGYLGWAYFGTFGYNLTVMVALLGLGLWSAVGGRVSMVVIAVALHFGTVVRAFGEENRRAALENMADEMAGDSMERERLLDIALDKRSLKLLIQSAELGQTDAMFKLATKYHQMGQTHLGQKYLKMAADAGDRAAQQDMCSNYDYGKHGLPVDVVIAARYCKLAADQGSPDAQAAIGWKYAFGEGEGGVAG